MTSQLLRVREAPVNLLVAGGILLSPLVGTAATSWSNREYHVRKVTESGAGATGPTSDGPVDAEVRQLQDEIRTTARLTRQQIAAALGVDRRSLAAWANGQTRPSGGRLSQLRLLAGFVRDLDVRQPGRAAELMTATYPGGRSALALFAAGRVDEARRLSARPPTQAVVSVVSRSERRTPLWAAAAVAMAEGRLTQPTALRTVRPEETYEMDVIESKVFREPQVTVGRKGYR